MQDIPSGTNQLSVLVFSGQVSMMVDMENTTVIQDYHGAKAIDDQVCEWLATIVLRFQPEKGHQVYAHERTVLSGREQQVMRLLSTGASNEHIALALGIGVCTVKTHLCRIYCKLGASNRLQAVSLHRENEVPGFENIIG